MAHTIAVGIRVVGDDPSALSTSHHGDPNHGANEEYNAVDLEAVAEAGMCGRRTVRVDEEKQK